MGGIASQAVHAIWRVKPPPPPNQSNAETYGCSLETLPSGLLPDNSAIIIRKKKN